MRSMSETVHETVYCPDITAVQFGRNSPLIQIAVDLSALACEVNIQKLYRQP